MAVINTVWCEQCRCLVLAETSLNGVIHVREDHTAIANANKALNQVRDEGWSK